MRRTIVFLLALSACQGGEEEPGPARAQFTLELSPAEVTLRAGGSASVAVTVTRSAGFAAAVDLALVGAPAGLSGTFDPDPAEGQSTLAVRAGTMRPGAYVAWVRGSSGEERETAALEVTVLPDESLTVSGRVVDAYRQPLAGLAVRLGAAVVTSDAEGRFTFSGVTAPYDVVVKRTTPALEAHVFRGLTRPDPTLPILNAAVPPARTASVSGFLSGGAGLPNAEDVVSAVIFSAPQGFNGTYVLPGEGPAYGPFEARWYGDVTETGVLHALQWEVDAQLLPRAFLGYGTAPLEVADGMASVGDVALAPASTGWISGVVGLPTASYAITRKVLWLNVGPYAGLFLARDSTPDTRFTYATPAVGLPIGFEAAATFAGRSTVAYRAGLLPTEVFDHRLPAPPALVAPAGGASGVTTATSFTWTPYERSVHLAAFASQAGADFYVYGSGTSATIPDLSSFGVPLARGATYGWFVWGIGPFADLDAYTAPDRGLGVAGLGEDALLGASETRSFVAAP